MLQQYQVILRCLGQEPGPHIYGADVSMMLSLSLSIPRRISSSTLALSLA